MTRRPLDTREWLEDMLRFAGRDADRARELLALMDRVDSGEYDEDQIIETLMEKSGNQTLDTIDAVAAEIKAFKDFQFALHDLLVEADLIKKNEYTTDPLTLLRMFLPVD